MNLSAEQLKSLLQEIMERLDHPLPEMRPIEIGLKDPVPRESRPKATGVLRKATFDLDKDVYDWLMTSIPETAVLKGIVWLEEMESEPPSFEKKAEKKQRKPSKKSQDGPHGKFWQGLFLSGFWSLADTHTLLGCDASNWREVMREAFNQSSTTLISPEEFLSWLEMMAGDDAGRVALWQPLIQYVERIQKRLKPEYAPDQYFSPEDLR